MVVRTLLVFAAALMLAPVALAAGGPDPGVLEAGSGIASTNGDVRFVTMPAGSLTTLEAIATHGGQIRNSALIRGGWGIPIVAYDGSAGGLSSNGRTLVLGQAGFGTCTPDGCSLLRRTTSFQIINPKTLRHRATVTLRGDFSFDALSPNGRRLYLIEHFSASNVNKYIVRAYDLERRHLLPGAIADRTQRGWLMQGIPMARASSTDGRYVYTLYANPGGYPFVHALDAVAGRAHCIGIPWTGETAQGDLNALQLSANGRELTLGRTSGHTFFTLDTRTYRVAPFATGPRGSFPWWTLSLLALTLPPAAFVLLRRKHSRDAALRRGPDLNAMPNRA